MSDATAETFQMQRGLPRPLYENMPIPYTSDHHLSDGEVHYSVAAVNSGRSHECIKDRLCMLCGEELTARSAVIAVYGDGDMGGNPLPKTPANRDVLESGAFHERCARMTMRHCPHLRDDANHQQPEIWVGPTIKFTPNGKVPKGWRRMKTTAVRRAKADTLATAA